MSVRIYTNPGNVIFPRPTVLRQYAPGRVPRQVRYTRSLSAPLELEKVFSYTPWETNKRDFTYSLLENKRRDLTNSALESKRRDFIYDPLGTKQRELTNFLWEIPTLETKRRDFVKNSLETKQREPLIPLSESKRRDFTKYNLENNRRDFTKYNLENNRRDLKNSYLDNKRRDFANSGLDCSKNDFPNNCLEIKRKDFTSSHLENNKSDLSNGYFENKVKDLSSNDLQTKSRTLPAAPRAMRWWNKDKSLCTIDNLLEIIREPTGHYELPTDPCNEVYPGIILSDGPTALCTSMLKRMGVSHVLNAAQGKERPGQVNTSPSFYSHSGIRFLGVEAFDHIAFRLYPYFDEASDFMQEAIDAGGKVLVHCRAGISRSATLVCAFLMLKRHLSAQEAIRTVRKNRAIIPNDGFLQQLCDLNERLHKTRGP